MAVYLYECRTPQEELAEKPTKVDFYLAKKEGMQFRFNSYNIDRKRIINSDGSITNQDRFSTYATGYVFRYFLDWDNKLFFAHLPVANKAYFLQKTPTSSSQHISHLEFIIANVIPLKS